MAVKDINTLTATTTEADTDLLALKQAATAPGKWSLANVWSWIQGKMTSGSGAAIKATGFNVGSNQVVGARVTGYTAMTGSPDKATAYATSTVTLAQLAGRIAQIQADLTTHGLLGP